MLSQFSACGSTRVMLYSWSSRLFFFGFSGFNLAWLPVYLHSHGFFISASTVEAAQAAFKERTYELLYSVLSRVKLGFCTQMSTSYVPF